MPINYSNYKTPIFPNINDNPVEPTASKAGNGSDLIARVNGLVDELQTTTDLLLSNTGLSSSYSVSVPDSINNEHIEIYYLNRAEYTFSESTSLNLYPEDLICSYTSNIDYSPGTAIDISSLIQQNGVGCYFFFFIKPDNSYKDDSDIFNLTCSPKGTARRLDKVLGVNVAVGFDTKLIQRVKPLVITMTTGTINAVLVDQQLVNSENQTA